MGASGVLERLGAWDGLGVFAFSHRCEKLRIIRVLIHSHLTFRQYAPDSPQKRALRLDSNMLESWSGRRKSLTCALNSCLAFLKEDNIPSTGDTQVRNMEDTPVMYGILAL